MIKHIFPIHIWEANYPGYNKEETVRYFDEYINRVGSHKLNYYIGNADTTASEFKDTDVMDTSSDNYPFVGHSMQELNMPELHDWLNIQITKYHEYHEYKDADKFQISNVWVNSSSQGGQVVLHNHSPALTSGVFYVDAYPEQGNLCLLNPNDAVKGKQWHQPTIMPGTDNHNFYRTKWYEFQVQSGRLILFPGYLYHQVLKNSTDHKRRVINFDVV